MRTDLLRLDVRLRRRMLTATGLAAAVYVLLVVAAYPAFKHDSGLDAMVSANPAAAAAFGITGSITSTSGWLNANMYANVAPLLALLLSIGYGATAIAGQNADGTLGLLATLPLTRTHAMAQKVAALLLVSAVVPAAALLACLAGPHFDLTPNWANLMGVSMALALLAFDLGAVALLVGATTDSRGAALGAAGAVAGAAYLLNALAPVVHAVHDLRWLSPFSWALGTDNLETGVQTSGLVALTALGAVLGLAALAGFRRLDIH